jgi:hypothetical protein
MKRRKTNPINSANSGDTNAAKTIVFIHGIGNKPPPDVLKLQWDRALLGFDLGERSRMSYWVNRELHGPPLGNDLDPDEVAALAPKVMGGGFGTKSLRTADSTPKMDPEAAEAMKRLSDKLGVNGGRDQAYGAKVLPLPGFAREWISRAVTSWLLEDVYDFLFVKERRQIMRNSLIARLSKGGGPFVIISHARAR